MLALMPPRSSRHRLDEDLLCLGTSVENGIFDLRDRGDLIDAFSSKGADGIGLDGVFERMFGMIRRYGLQMPDSLAMLFITMGTLEGVGSTLDPDFDFVEAAKPMVEKLLPQRWGRQRLERACAGSRIRAPYVGDNGAHPQRLHCLSTQF